MTCTCGWTMRKIAESERDERGRKWVSYRCEHCHRVIKVLEY